MQTPELSSGVFVTRPSVNKCGNGSLRWLKDAEPYFMNLIQHPVLKHPSFTAATPLQGVSVLFDQACSGKAAYLLLNSHPLRDVLQAVGIFPS